MSLRKLIGFVRWYVREMTGAADYDRHLARHGTDSRALTRREFERLRTARQESNPGSRCC
jgi:uncharacterized short protein YbdD (DUF466 family)